MLIRSLVIHNILSIETAEVNFGQTGLILVDGWNFDDNTANGAGKTAIFNALSFGLYGKMPRDITASEYLRRDTKSGYVEVKIDCGGELWTVRRERPTNLVFWNNNEPEKITQEEFEKKLGLTYGQFLLTIYASQLKTNKFILLNDSGKKDFLLQLLNLEQFTVAKNNAAQLVKDIAAKGGKLDLAITALGSKIQTSKDFLVDEKSVQERLSEWTVQISAMDCQIQQLGLVPKPDLSKYQALEDSVAQKRAEFQVIRAEHAQTRRNWTALYSQLKTVKEIDAMDCPHCAQKVVAGGDVLLRADDVSAQQQFIETHNQSLQQQMETINVEVQVLQTKLNEESKITDLSNKIRAKRLVDSEEYEQAVAGISNLQVQKYRLETSAASLQNKLTESIALQDKILAYEEEKTKLTTAFDKLSSEMVVAETLVHMFSPVGISAYIFDMVIGMLNQYAAVYLDHLLPNASYQLLSYRETKSGETKAKFSEKICKGGKETSLGALSGGELRCISLAVDLAVIDVVCKMSGAQLNPLILDEPYDGMDNSNRERAMELISKLANDKEIWVIDHSSEVCAMFSKTIRVEKRNDISVLV